MKKTYIVLTVLAMAALVSCQEEKEINYKSLEKDVVGFYLRESGATKAGDVTMRGVTIPIGDDGHHSFILEQTITDLDAMGPETKGTPAYTMNVKDLYDGKFNAALVGKTVKRYGDEFVFDESYGKYYFKYPENIWTDDNVPLYFYMWMPGDLGDAVNGGSDFAAANFDSGKITFAYDGSQLLAASADSVLAKDMTDLLFTSRYFTGQGTGANQYDVKNGADLLFHHVFTGVKFASSNSEDDDEKITINEVIFRGLQDKGTCVVTPQTEEGDYKDLSDVFSSELTSVWTPAASPVSGTSYSTGAFAKDFAEYSSEKFPASFTGAGADRNFNDSDATQTLWIMPQTIAEGVKLTIKYTITRPEGDETDEWTIDFGEYLSKSNTQIQLKAGQLHTFYIKIDDVNVMIEDEVDSATETKSNVKITNTGSVDAYIRASIIGQWLDDDGNPVFGFQDSITEYKEVDSWYDDQFGDRVDDTQTTQHGTFYDLAGYTRGETPCGNPLNDWVLCKDGFYYYQKVVKAGETTDSPLFTKYEVNTGFPRVIPFGVKEYNIHFQLEIATQAVSAKMTAEKNGKTEYTWDEAWERALGSKPEKK